MAFEFPAAPSVGDTYSRFTWDGVAWNVTASESSDLELRLAALETKTEDIRNFTAPTGADGEPGDYNVLVVDKANGQVRAIPAPDFIEPE